MNLPFEICGLVIDYLPTITFVGDFKTLQASCQFCGELLAYHIFTDEWNEDWGTAWSHSYWQQRTLWKDEAIKDLNLEIFKHICQFNKETASTE